ncbi:hypothetical protein EI94DRAFT_1299272 [Lactarius quietus]|nr:hypothetical protein EI94DRAFT_1299272 [Lactarius quietus]
MDVVLSDVPFAKGNLCDLEDVVLSTYRAILTGCSSRGYTMGFYNPGLLYSEMRSKQAFVAVEDDIHAWYTAPKRSPPEDPVTHLSPPDWKRVYKEGSEERQLTHSIVILLPPTTNLLHLWLRRELGTRSRRRFSTCVVHQKRKSKPRSVTEERSHMRGRVLCGCEQQGR